MSYKALYRTYRPSTFDEVAGQQHIVKTLRNALASGKIAHAYLFAGPRGTGKTTMAKIVAKALNCEEGVGCQCNHCQNCEAINKGSHPDVLEIDAASNNGVEQIRDLIDKIKYSTSLGKYKVFIIDEVHMMTPGAFNALLKTLEEPPEHVVFILATTEPHKILPTILSRCQRYDFSKLSDDEIKDRIKVVLDKENIQYNEDAVNLIISLSDGGMRDALSILDQVLAYGGNTLNEKDILDMFALESKEEMINLLVSLATSNTPDVLSRINKYISRGTDIKRLTFDLLDLLKDLMVYETSGSIEFMQKLDQSNAEELSKYINEDKALAMIDGFMTAIKDFKNVTSINPLFEVTLLKLVSMNKAKSTTYNEPVKFQEEAKPEPVKIIEPIKEESIVKESNSQSEPPKTLNISLEPKPVEKEVEKKEEEPIEETPVVLSEDVLVLKGSDEASATHFQIEDKTLIEIIASSKKDIKNKLLDSWDNLKRLVPHPSLGRAATMLVDGHLLVASQKIMIIEHPIQRNVDNINEKSIQKNIQDVVTTVFGKKMFVYAITRAESVKLQKEFLDRKQLGKLPKVEDIILEFEGEN